MYIPNETIPNLVQIYAAKHQLYTCRTPDNKFYIDFSVYHIPDTTKKLGKIFINYSEAQVPSVKFLPLECDHDKFRKIFTSLKNVDVSEFKVFDQNLINEALDLYFGFIYKTYVHNPKIYSRDAFIQLIDNDLSKLGVKCYEGALNWKRYNLCNPQDVIRYVLIDETLTQNYIINFFRDHACLNHYFVEDLNNNSLDYTSSVKFVYDVQASFEMIKLIKVYQRLEQKLLISL